MTELKRGGYRCNISQQVGSVRAIHSKGGGWGEVPPSILNLPPNASYLQSWDSMTFCCAPFYFWGHVEEVYSRMLNLSVQAWGSSLLWFDWKFSPSSIDYVPFVYSAGVVDESFSYPCPNGWDSIETYTPQ